ncbi:transcription antitermination factor NusB [Tumidithrix helvetica PCC 7403]|uniref:transcription antitermination factor NusB n=1 Tax=Tumidithrix helvetica TaxID=3457545 RepID=UPI003CA63EC6
MQARHVARELALLSIHQLPTQPENLATKTIDEMVTAVVRSLTDEVKEMLLTASVELQRGQDKMLNSETRVDDPKVDIKSAQVMVRDAINLTEAAINRVGTALEFPLMLQISRQTEIRSYALELLNTVHKQRSLIDATIGNALIDWQLSRLAQVDQDILRLATAEIMYLDVPKQVAINEAVELAKRYSTEDGYRFINGVLRRILEQMREAAQSATSERS